MNARRLLAYGALHAYCPEAIQYLRQVQHLLQDQEIYFAHVNQSLSNLLTHARDHVPYYHDLFQSMGLPQSGPLDASHLPCIPILTKEIIRREGNRLLSPSAGHATANTSGGSTGEPIRLLQDKQYTARSIADTILFSLLNGKHPGDSEIKLWGSERDIQEGSQSLKDRTINRLFNRTFLNAFRMTELDMGRFLDTINSIQPVQIWCYVDSIDELARFARAKGLNMYSPRNIVTTAGTLYPEMRTGIQRAFPESRILNQYGSREVSLIACQIEHDADLLVFSHSNRVEIMDRGSGKCVAQKGASGNVLVTNLNNFAMPLIRYDIGDVATCGRVNSTGDVTHLAAINGRENSHFVTRNGDLIHGEYFTHLFYGRRWVQNFQVLQTSPNHVKILYVSSGYTLPDLDRRDIVEKIRSIMTSDTEVDFEQVETIGRLQSGKYQFVRRMF